MKERPILFSTPMVRAILDGQKTQTRRIFKHNITQLEVDKVGYTAFTPEGCISIRGTRKIDGNGYAEWFVKCPYGQPGDRLWVRETWAKVCHSENGQCYGDECLECSFEYRADNPGQKWAGDWPNELPGLEVPDGCKWKPSLFMPRAASRIMLEIEQIRVERLQQISEADAISEGASELLTRDDLMLFSELDPHIPRPFAPHQFGFLKIWLLINGAKSWNDNPWVWVITFKKISHGYP